MDVCFDQARQHQPGFDPVTRPLTVQGVGHCNDQTAPDPDIDC